MTNIFPTLRYRDAAAAIDFPEGLQDQPSGSRDFSARDPEGNVWSFGTYRPG